MAKAKDENKLQIQLKIDRLKDKEIFDILNVSDNKSDFIKDALFYFVYHIEQGKVINRNYPYNKVNINLDIIKDSNEEPIVKIKEEEKQPFVSKIPNETYEAYEEYEDDEDYDYNDNLDDVEI